jgi:hypothetical protein
MKVSGIKADALRQAIAPLVEKVVDVQEKVAA